MTNYAMMQRALYPAPQTPRGAIELAIWFALYCLLIAIPMATGASNGIGYFQQVKGHSLWAPMLLGGAVNLFIAAWHAERVMPLLQRADNRFQYVSALLVIIIFYLAAHLTYQLCLAATGEPDLRSISIFSWTIENLMALPIVIAISGAYKIARDWFIHMSGHLDLVDKAERLEQEFSVVRSELTAIKERVGADNLLKFESGREKHQLPLSSIFFLKAAGNYVEINSSSKTHTVYGALSNFEKKLSAANFVRVHRSYLVNIERIECISGSILTINGVEIPIGSTYKGKLLSRWREEQGR